MYFILGLLALLVVPECFYDLISVNIVSTALATSSSIVVDSTATRILIDLTAPPIKREWLSA
jgi:hypothetical protein